MNGVSLDALRAMKQSAALRVSMGRLQGQRVSFRNDSPLIRTVLDT
jgi:hypothetical protein